MSRRIAVGAKESEHLSDFYLLSGLWKGQITTQSGSFAFTNIHTYIHAAQTGLSVGVLQGMLSSFTRDQKGQRGSGQVGVYCQSACFSPTNMLLYRQPNFRDRIQNESIAEQQ